MPAPKITLEKIESSNLLAIGWDGGTNTLAVQFKNGHIFHYTGLTPELALQFYGAESKGSFYAKYIRGVFSAQKMTGACPKCGSEPGWIGEKCDDCGTADFAEAKRDAR